MVFSVWFGASNGYEVVLLLVATAATGAYVASVLRPERFQVRVLKAEAPVGDAPITESRIPIPHPSLLFALAVSLTEALFYFSLPVLLLAVFGLYVYALLLLLALILAAFLTVGFPLYSQSKVNKRKHGVALLAILLFLESLILITTKHYYV